MTIEEEDKRVELVPADSRLKTITWAEGGQNLMLEFQGPHLGANDPQELVACELHWVTDLSINLDFGKYGDLPLVWQSSGTRLADNEWEVEIDFGGTPAGSLRCRCNRFRVDRHQDDGRSSA